ncbi:transmembrane protein 201 [Synchiropus splendidus]|uniref:transmembrane protein 201 n=1 Tax=Synchiropus splendidus TaxID=270530 RepID=UPI00237EDBA9|nr:transmembrane protein 201 [Synchiropus splendidus]
MDTFNHLLLKHPHVMYGGVAATAFVAGGALIYKVANRKKPTHANVNCWFCNEDSVVPYGNRNCWDCPNCDQYNGFQDNGDYNKPIPAQYREDLNHGVAGCPPSPASHVKQQWVNAQLLLCKKCNNNQTAKIKQLASFIPRDDENYDEEIDAYKHHLEQTYKLCKPCQTAVDYYLKFQNRQLRVSLLSRHLKRTRESIKGFMKSSYSVSSSLGVVYLRALAFIICTFLVSTYFCNFHDETSSANGLHTPPKSKLNESISNKEASVLVHLWQRVLENLPDATMGKSMWQLGKDNQITMVTVGLFTCLTAICFAGSVGLRRIDVLALVLWFVLLCVHLAERYMDITASWMGTAKLVASSACCFVSLAVAVVNHKTLGQRSCNNRRLLASGAAVPPITTQPCCSRVEEEDPFVLTPPPNLFKLINRQKSPLARKASPSSLSVRLNRTLSLGTMPSLKRTESGYLFSGTRPTSPNADSPPSDYFSWKSTSHPSSPEHSPTPSVAGSTVSLSSSARRRPLISPATFNMRTQKLRLYSTQTEPKISSTQVSMSHFHIQRSSLNSFMPPDLSADHADENSEFKDNGLTEESRSSSGSSACLVGTTTENPLCTTPSEGFLKRLFWPLLFLTSMSANLFFICLYLNPDWAVNLT